MVYWIGLLIPFAYLGVLVGSLVTFSTLYRKRQAAKASNLEPWFGQNIPRDVFLTLRHAGDEDKPETKTPDDLLKMALMRRAAEAVRRLVKLRAYHGPLTMLVQNGVLGDDMIQRHQIANMDLEAELKDIQEEANVLSQGWAQTIFPFSSEIAQNDKIEKVVESIQSRVPANCAWYSNLSAAPSAVSTGTSTPQQGLAQRNPNLAVPELSSGDGESAVNKPLKVDSPVAATTSSSSPVSAADGSKAKRRKGKKSSA